MAKMIEHAEKEDHIERAERLRVQLIHVARKPRDLGTEIVAANSKTSYVARDGVDANHFFRSPSFCLEGKEAFTATDVEDTHPLHPGRQSKVRELAILRIIPARSDEFRIKLNLVKPIVFFLDLRSGPVSDESSIQIGLSLKRTVTPSVHCRCGTSTLPESPLS